MGERRHVRDTSGTRPRHSLGAGRGPTDYGYAHGEGTMIAVDISYSAIYIAGIDGL